MSKEQEIKIKINKESARIYEAPEENIMPAFAENETEKERKFFNPEKLAAFFFTPLFFDADFCAPLWPSLRLLPAKPFFFRRHFADGFLFNLVRASKGSVKIPKSALLISCLAVVLVWLVSALFSGNAGLSLAGKLYDLDTFSVIFAASLALFFGSMIFQSEKEPLFFI